MLDDKTILLTGGTRWNGNALISNSIFFRKKDKNDVLHPSLRNGCPTNVSNFSRKTDHKRDKPKK